MATGRASVGVALGDVVGFRLRAHHLLTRSRDLLAVAGACAVQNSPPGSALLALHARAEDVTVARFEHLVGTEKSLVQTWCMRGAPYFFPTADLPVFTTGVLPTTEAARLRLIGGVEPALRTLDLGLDDIVERVADQLVPVLAHRALPIDDLGRDIAGRLARTLSPARRADWRAPGPYGANQPLGEAVVHFCVRILTLRGLVCLAPRSDNTAPFVLLGEWLGASPPRTEPDAARSALLRRYLRCYGPSTRKDFATWLGIDAGQVDPWWAVARDELTPVEVEGRRAWIHIDDLDDLRSPVTAHGVRLLPPSDPYLQLRDRATIVDPAHHRAVWKTAGAPGVVLAEGDVAGIWRPRKKGRTLTLTVTAFRSMSTRLRAQVRAEAAAVATLRGASDVHVEFGAAP